MRKFKREKEKINENEKIFFKNGNIIDKLIAWLRIKMEGKHKLPISDMKESSSFKNIIEYYIKLYNHKFDTLKEMD